MSKHTPGPWFVGCQNDALFIIAGRAPSLNNDDPFHDAVREPVAKIYDAAKDDRIPIFPDANARLIAAAPEMYDALVEITRALTATSSDNPAIVKVGQLVGQFPMFRNARNIIARIDGESEGQPT